MATRPSLAALLALTLVTALYFPTFGLGWAYDDIDHLNVAADALGGKRSIVATALLPHNGHVIATFRLLLTGYLKFVGTDAALLRVAVALLHALSAWFLALLAMRLCERDQEARAAVPLSVVSVYLGACGLSSMWIWFPSGAPVPMATAAITGAALLVARRESLMVRRVVAAAAVLFALMTESAFAPMALLPALVDELERRREGEPRRPGGFTLFVLGSIASALGLTAALAGAAGRPVPVDVVRGLPRALFLLLVWPFRLFFPGVPIGAGDGYRSTAILGSVLGSIVAALVIALLVVLWRRRVPSLALLALAAAIPAGGVIVLVGLARAGSSYAELYDADRYFFPLLVPVSLLAGAVAGSLPLSALAVRPRQVVVLALALALCGELALHRRAMLWRIPTDVYARHRGIFRDLALLGTRLSLLARHSPLVVPDSSLWLDGLHNGHVSAHLLAQGFVRDGNVRVGSPAPNDEQRVDVALEAWSRDLGKPVPFIRLAGARFVNFTTPARIDFREGAWDGSVGAGLAPWERGFRWMGRSGELRLMLVSRTLTLELETPFSAIRARHPSIDSIPIDVTAFDDEVRLIVPLGRIEVRDDGVRAYRLDASTFVSRVGRGRTVRLQLKAGKVWRPVDVIAGSADPRELSVRIVSVSSAPTDD